MLGAGHAQLLSVLSFSLVSTRSYGRFVSVRRLVRQYVVVVTFSAVVCSGGRFSCLMRNSTTPPNLAGAGRFAGL